jgi:hypothetical protein
MNGGLVAYGPGSYFKSGSRRYLKKVDLC